MPNSTLGPVQIFSLDLCSINLALMEIQNRLDEGKGLRGEAIVNDRVRLHNTPVQDLNVEPDIVTNVYAETPRGVPPLQQVETILGEGLVGLQPLVAPPSVGNMSLIGSDLTRYASEGHTHEGVNLADTQTITGIKTLGAAALATGALKFAGITSGVVTVQVAAAAGTWALTLPTTDGNAGEALITDGSGVASWAAVALLAQNNTFTGAQTVFETTTAPGVTINLSGNASPTAPPASGVLWVIGKDTVNSSMIYDTYADVGGSSLIFRRAKNNTASPSAVTNNLSLGGIQCLGWDGSGTFQGGAQVRGSTTEAWSTTAHGAAIDFLTVSNGATTLTARGRLGDGLMIGTTTDQGAGTIHANVAYYTAAKVTALMVTGTEQALGDASDTLRLRTSAATPTSLTDGDWWVDCTGTSPTRICAIKVRDGGATRTIASVTY